MLSLPNELLGAIVIATMEYDDIMAIYGICKQFQDIISTLYHQIYNVVADRYHTMFGSGSILSYIEYMTRERKWIWITKMEWGSGFRCWMKNHINTRSRDTYVSIKSHLIHNTTDHIACARNIQLHDKDIQYPFEYLPYGTLNYLTEYQIYPTIFKYIHTHSNNEIRKVINHGGFASNYILSIMIVDHFQLLHTILTDIGIAVKKTIVDRVRARDVQLYNSLLEHYHLSDVFKYMLSQYPSHTNINYNTTPQVKLVMSVYNK